MSSPPVKTVLVVDDEPAIRMLCRVNLELEGFRVLEAEGPDAAREILDAEPVDVALVDIHLGEANGNELVRELRARDRAPRIALLTGSSGLDDEERAVTDAVIEKPFTLDELVSTVKQLAGAVDSPT